MRVVGRPYPNQERDFILAHVLAFRIGVGSTVRSPGREDDFGPCHWPAVPVVGLDVDLEHRRCTGYQLASIDRTVRLFSSYPQSHVTIIDSITQSRNTITQATHHSIYARTHSHLRRPHFSSLVPLVRPLRRRRHQRHHELSRDRMPHGAQEGRERILASVVLVGSD